MTMEVDKFIQMNQRGWTPDSEFLMTSSPKKHLVAVQHQKNLLQLSHLAMILHSSKVPGYTAGESIPGQVNKTQSTETTDSDLYVGDFFEEVDVFDISAFIEGIKKRGQTSSFRQNRSA